jgi:hypothetical protein
MINSTYTIAGKNNIDHALAVNRTYFIHASVWADTSID